MDIGGLQGDLLRTTSHSFSSATASSAVAGRGDENIGITGMGKSDFLKLLVAQLRNQDPLKPMEDKEFIAQMALLNTVEQVSAMNLKLDELVFHEAIAQASSFIGKLIEAEPSEGDVVQGVVQGIEIADDRPILVVGGRRVELTDVRRVARAA